jgi:hypothetical protein
MFDEISRVLLSAKGGACRNEWALIDARPMPDSALRDDFSGWWSRKFTIAGRGD